MRRRLLFALLAAILIGGALFLWHRSAGQPAASGPGWLDRLGAAIGLRPINKAGQFSGYVEADYVMATSTVGGTLTRLDVSRGQQVKAGARLFALDDTSERAARDEAAERLRQARAQLANLQSGRRQPEIEAILAQRAQAEAAFRQSQADFERQSRLYASGTSTKKQLDDARAQRDRDRARIQELNAELQLARMPSREDEIKAAEAAVGAAQAALDQANWRLGQLTGNAPTDAMVVDTLYRPGEAVAANKPIVQLLPPGNIKVRFFVPEAVVGRLKVGEAVQVTCDGCSAPIAATINFVSPQAEFTPPVIYSRQERSRLVFMAEAHPDRNPERLRVGQPVDVSLVQP